MAKKHYLTATLPDGYIKTIGPTPVEFSHYWRIVAHLSKGGDRNILGSYKVVGRGKEEAERGNRGGRSARLESL